MSKKILGLDLGSNSIGWAVLETDEGESSAILGLGSRIFTKAVEDKTPTPKNQARRNSRLARRVIQRRARRKQRMLNYLVKLSLLPKELQGNHQPEIIFNKLGNPYKLRAKALNEQLSPYELGRVFLHLAQRRGFLSNRKTLLGDLVDDPDVIDILNEAEFSEEKATKKSEETAFKNDIATLRERINASGKKTLGEFLASLPKGENKRNRLVNGGHLRTDRQMYQQELALIFQQQMKYHEALTPIVQSEIEDIIFKQRPLKLNPRRVGYCSLEPGRKRCRIARQEAQRFRYLQDINNLTYFDAYVDRELSISDKDRLKVVTLFETESLVTVTKLKKVLGLSRSQTFNLERGNKKLKGNTTACSIREVFPEWDQLSEIQQRDFCEDLITINKKSTLKARLVNHWKLGSDVAIRLCILELEPGHSNLSLKAINRLLPFLEQGLIYSEARQQAEYHYNREEREVLERLPRPPKTSNPIVNKGLHELRRVVNAVIAEYGKPDAIRLEMARDLEMNTKRYKAFISQQNKNTKANDEAVKKYQEMSAANPHLYLSKYPGRQDKIKYRIWKDQGECCAYSRRRISLSTLFSPDVDVDHILPYSQSLDDSYMNKVVCFTGENRFKGQRTPIDAYGGNNEKWEQITQAIANWDKSLLSKRKRFFLTAEDVQERDFAASQLNDTRYISRVALEYLSCLGGSISVTKGFLVSWLRYQWGLNSLIGTNNEKDRSDHRHHVIDAIVIASIDRQFHKTLCGAARHIESQNPEFQVKDLVVDPPWKSLRKDLGEALEEVIIAHDPQRKISGALHEDTGIGFKEKHGAVYRKNLDSNFTSSQLKKVLDPEVKLLIERHLDKFGGDVKRAFADDQTIYHRDGKTPIKRVRILQSRTTKKKLDKTKFGVRNKQGDVFKWLAYGNTHHVEVIQHGETSKISARFVTAMEAAARAKGVGGQKSTIVKTDHGDDYQFLMALHINELVNVEQEGELRIYRVQKIEATVNRMVLRLHTAANLNNKSEEIYFTFNSTSFDKWNLKKLAVNVLGKRYDKANC